MTEFSLHHQLANDTFLICELRFCRVLLMNDKRWPWVILVPRRVGLEEWHDLSDTEADAVSADIKQVSGTLHSITECEKINVGALGNMVRQMHIHVIARSSGDPNWPGPVWGHGASQSYEESELAYFRKRLCDALS